MKRNITGFIATGVLILLLAVFLISAPGRGWLHSNGSQQENAKSPEIAGKHAESHPESTNSKRQRPDDRQIAARVKSMLELRSNEVSFISIPADELPAMLESIQPEWVPNSPPLNTAEVAGGAIRSQLEAMLRRGSRLGAKVGDSGIFEWSDGDRHMTLMRATDPEPEQAEIILQYSDGQHVTSRSLPVAKGNSLLIQFPDPTAGAVVIAIGSASANPEVPTTIR